MTAPSMRSPLDRATWRLLRDRGGSPRAADIIERHHADVWHAAQAEVRRIAREEADKAVAQAREAEKIEAEERRKMSLWPHDDPTANAPPVQPMERDMSKPQISDNGFPRRIRMDLWTAAEKAIHDAVQAVEAAGAHPLLTDAVILLNDAKEKVADHVELEPVKPAARERIGGWLCSDTKHPGVVVFVSDEGQRPPPGAHYYTTFPGVHDAASAEAFARAVRGLFDATLEAGALGTMPALRIDHARKALAPFLPDVPR